MFVPITMITIRNEYHIYVHNAMKNAAKHSNSDDTDTTKMLNVSSYFVNLIFFLLDMLTKTRYLR